MTTTTTTTTVTTTTTRLTLVFVGLVLRQVAEQLLGHGERAARAHLAHSVQPASNSRRSVTSSVISGVTSSNSNGGNNSIINTCTLYFLLRTVIATIQAARPKSNLDWVSLKIAVSQRRFYKTL